MQIKVKYNESYEHTFIVPRNTVGYMINEKIDNIYINNIGMGKPIFRAVKAGCEWISNTLFIPITLIVEIIHDEENYPND